jgi:IS30 family transposase
VFVSATEIGTRELVRRLLASGLSRAEVARELGLTKGTVSYHARRLGEDVDARCARRYDWAAVQTYYDAGHSVRECQAGARGCRHPVPRRRAAHCEECGLYGVRDDNRLVISGG